MDEKENEDLIWDYLERKRVLAGNGRRFNVEQHLRFCKALETFCTDELLTLKWKQSKQNLEGWKNDFYENTNFGSQIWGIHESEFFNNLSNIKKKKNRIQWCEHWLIFTGLWLSGSNGRQCVERPEKINKLRRQNVGITETTERKKIKVRHLAVKLFTENVSRYRRLSKENKIIKTGLKIRSCEDNKIWKVFEAYREQAEHEEVFTHNDGLTFYTKLPNEDLEIFESPITEIETERFILNEGAYEVFDPWRVWIFPKKSCTEIGRGTYSIVIPGRELRSGTGIAAKINHSGDEESKGSIEQEAKVLKWLDHEHIIKALDFFAVGNDVWLILPLYDCSLSQALVFVSEDPGRIRTYYGQLQSAFRYLRKKKIVHGDVKPQNILCRGTDAVVLSDFGECVGNQSVRNYNCYSLWWRAPQVLLGAKDRTFQTDAWAFSIVALDMIKGNYFHGACRGSIDCLSQILEFTGPGKPFQKSGLKLQPSHWLQNGDVLVHAMKSLQWEPQERRYECPFQADISSETLNGIV